MHTQAGEVECGRCGNICMIDGEFPRYYVWCDECSAYVTDFDGTRYARDVAASIADGRSNDRATDIVQ